LKYKERRQCLKSKEKKPRGKETEHLKAKEKKTRGKETEYLKAKEKNSGPRR